MYGILIPGSLPNRIAFDSKNQVLARCADAPAEPRREHRLPHRYLQKNRLFPPAPSDLSQFLGAQWEQRDLRRSGEYPKLSAKSAEACSLTPKSPKRMTNPPRKRDDYPRRIARVEQRQHEDWMSQNPREKAWILTVR